MFSAKALYNNVADTPDELSFSKGDVLEVHEKDDNGWWVCSLKGKVGIAPGNRLQIQSAAGSSSRGVSPSGRNSPSTNQVLPSGQKLPPPGSSSVQLGQKSPANDQSVRQNWHLNNKVVVPKKSGNVYVYEPPINQVMQDYDVPPSRHRDIRHGGGVVTSVGSAQLNQTSGFDSIDALQNYDVPSSLRCSTMQASPDNYDRLPAFTRIASSRTMERDVLLPPKNASSLIYDIPPAWNASDMMSELASNRSSVLSVLSTGSQSSACSGHSSLGGSVSARSSVDVSTHEIYDVPLSSRAMSGAEVAPRQLQTHAEQGMLDGVGGAQSAASSPFAKKDFGKQNSAAGPPCSLKLHVDRDSYLEDYSVPRSDVSQGSGDSGISVSNVDPFGAARPCSDELYDTPRKLVSDAGQRCDPNNQSKSEEVTYDVPNQINCRSRDNNNSAVEGGAGLDELSFVGLDDNGARISNPTDILVQLQSTVLSHSSKLVGLISRILSDGGNQGQELSQVKLACLATKTALKEVIDYGNGGLGQALDSSSASSKELSEKVFELLDKVHVQLQYLSRHVEKLLTTQWPPRRREKPVFGGGISELDDTLNTIGMLTEAVSGHLQTLTRFVVQNSSSLFRRGSSTATVENGVVARDPNRSAKDDAKCRPPLPPATKAKAKFGGQDSTERQSLATVQERPLPPVPCQASTISVCKFPRLPPSSSSQVNSAASGTGFEESNSNEWNDDCDYVSIANEAEKEMKVCEKRLDHEDEPEKPMVGRNTHHGIHKEAVCSGENFSSGSSPERKAAAPSPIGKLKYPTPPVPPSTIPTNPGVAASSGNADHPSSVSRVGAHENGHAVDSRSLDSQNVAFYVDQSETHFTVVDSAVREFFQMIFNDRVTAKEFLLRSKFVILAAHKLVYIGDTITRNSLHSSSAQNQIAARANNLCDILKETVAATKTSALNFPQNLTQQRLIDCMKAVLQASLQLCEAIRSIAVRV